MLKSKALTDGISRMNTDFESTEKTYHQLVAQKRELESELNARQTAYETIYKERAAAAMNFTTRSYTLRGPSEPSISDKKASPKLALNVLVGAILGLLVGIVWGLASSYRDLQRA